MHSLVKTFAFPIVANFSVGSIKVIELVVPRKFVCFRSLLAPSSSD